MAEMDLDSLRNMLERLELYVEEEGGFSRGQRDAIVASAEALLLIPTLWFFGSGRIMCAW